MKSKIAVILVAGSYKQNSCFWPSYTRTYCDCKFDLIFVHRNMKYVPMNIKNENGDLISEDKIFPTGELEHKAFGAYRYYFEKYKKDYDYFIFVSDDVILKRNLWIDVCVNLLNHSPRLGFVGSQIFNSLNGQYPHESHCRAPLWAAKTEALKEIKWEFSSDHDGEMKLARQFLEAGYFGVQVGNKIDIGYDALENGGYFEGDHITAIMEKRITGFDSLRKQFNYLDITSMDVFIAGLKKETVKSPFDHIGEKEIIKDLEPFHGLIYDESVSIAEKFCNLKTNYYGAKILEI